MAARGCVAATLVGRSRAPRLPWSWTSQAPCNNCGNYAVFSSPLIIGRRTVAGVRRLLGDFIRAVHPDLTPTFPVEARRINQRSLAELNSFVDSLEEPSPCLEDGPQVARELPFFRACVARSDGRHLPGRVLPLCINLPTVPVMAAESEREYAAARLIRDAEVALARPASAFADRPDVAPLFTQKGAGRAAFDKLWWQQTRDEMVLQALHGPDDAEVRKQAAMIVFAQKYEYQLLRRITRIKNNRRRKKKLAAVAEQVQTKVQARFQTTDKETYIPEPDEEAGDRKQAARVLKSGFHPDLVFVAPDVSAQRKREAIRRVCGMNLLSEADFWLLENLWKAMRSHPPPVPLVVANADYKAHLDAGFVQVPWNFTVAELCDLLEEHLDAVREGLKRRRGESLARAAVLPPPPELEDFARDGDTEDEDDDDYEDVT